jgi:hypothetical protein
LTRDQHKTAWTVRAHKAALTGKIAPTRLQGINLRGVFRFPVERYANEILPSQGVAITGTNR